MARIQTISQLKATGQLKKEYEAAMTRAGKVFNVVQIMSLNPTTLHASMEFYKATMQRPSSLSRPLREMIAVVVSAANQCHY